MVHLMGTEFSVVDRNWSLDKLWHQRLERASFESEHAGRHYHLVEPENRLVARQLDQDWENALQVEQQLKEEYERFSHKQPKQLTDEEKKQILQLSECIPTLWFTETTTHTQRKEIVRQVITSLTTFTKCSLIFSHKPSLTQRR
ncbi:MAG: hypothetical protein AAGA46_05150 [Cyanobacteria bacterium P01_F01_bin.13]